MKKILFPLAVFLSLQGSAQDALTKSFSKAKPVQVLSLDGGVAYSMTLKQLQNRSPFKGKEAEAVYERLHNSEARPASTTDVTEEVMAHYKVYELASFRFITGYGYSLVWLPQAENAHMPPSLRLPLPEGYILWLPKKEVAYDGKGSSGKILPLAGSPLSGGSITTASGIPTPVAPLSKADGSAFTQPFLGCMAYTDAAKNLMYIVPVEGTGTVNGEATARATFAATVTGGNYTKYEWFAGTDALTLIRRFRDKMTVVQQQPYTLQ